MRNWMILAAAILALLWLPMQSDAGVKVGVGLCGVKVQVGCPPACPPVCCDPCCQPAEHRHKMRCKTVRACVEGRCMCHQEYWCKCRGCDYGYCSVPVDCGPCCEPCCDPCPPDPCCKRPGLFARLRARCQSKHCCPEPQCCPDACAPAGCGDCEPIAPGPHDGPLVPAPDKGAEIQPVPTLAPVE